jgi:16S rRNA (uracil1498-N3)-methyltransferase
VGRPRIHTPQELRQGLTAQLETGASRHISAALRLQVGDEVTLFNGRGGEYPATIARVERKQVTVEIGAFREQDVESPLQIHLGIVLSRGDRFDWLVQKATELGVATISPLFSERCEVKLKGERGEKKLRHWQQIAISACEQCGRNRVPDISAPRQLASWCENADADVRLVLHHRAEATPELTQRPASAALLIGPEGGLTDAEIDMARARGFAPLALGPRVLRTETAPLAACAILQWRWGDMAETRSTT